MRKSLAFLVTLVLLFSVFTLSSSSAYAATSSHLRSSQAARGGCYAGSCNGKLENQVNPPCSISQRDVQGDNVYDAYGNFMGVVHIFTNSDCNSFWGGFRASYNGLQNVHLQAGNYNNVYEGGPAGNINSGQWQSSYMFEWLGHPCLSAWVYGYSSITGTDFSHKIIYGGSGC